MAFVRDLGSLGKDDAAIAGGKAASLGEMIRAGMPVPPGFVVLATAFDHFIDEAGLGPAIKLAWDSIRVNGEQSIEGASASLQALIMGAKMPEVVAAEILQAFRQMNCPLVAVRSSATSEDSADAAWAGQLTTFLNTGEPDLLRSVQRCWASLFTPRAIFYRREKGLEAEQMSVAVAVQKMVASEVSGIAFSVHPVTQDRNTMMIEAAPGLGEAIVSGQITPDGYVVTKEPREITDRNVVSGRQALPDAQVLELAGLVMAIETHYGFPCDIEWALEGGKLYILQSRPITTLNVTSDIIKA